MARRALLIGTEKYGKEFGRLEATPRNVLALAEVLADPLMGGFEKPETLIDPDHSKMAETIETWLRSHTKDDFVLLYIAGHGVMDLKRKLYFAASSSRKVQDELVTSTAVSARNVHDWLQACRAKRQIVILDCCFSGAFGDLVAQDDGSIDVESVLGAEGRVVLTSSSSTQYSFQQREGKLSVYTNHLIEGITSGAADLDDDGKISTDELYQYTLRKVQEESPGMTPKMIVTKDAGYRLRIANTPMDAKVKYRKEVDLIVQKFGDTIKSLGRAKLKIIQSNLELSDDEVREIESKVLEPIQLRKAKLVQYREIFTEAVKEEYPFDELHIQTLDEIKALLGFSDEDVAIVEAEVKAEIQPELLIKKSVTVEFDRLEDLLKKHQWKEANDETLRLLLCLADRPPEDGLLVGDIRNFSQDDLNTIDALWSQANQGRFGFGIQARIFDQSIGDSGISKSEAWQLFDDLIEWRKDEKNCYIFNLSAPEGHLPHWRKLISGWGVSDRGISFLKRGLDCPIGSFDAIEAEDIEVDAIVPPSSEITIFTKDDLGESGIAIKPISVRLLELETSLEKNLYKPLIKNQELMAGVGIAFKETYGQTIDRLKARFLDDEKEYLKRLDLELRERDILEENASHIVDEILDEIYMTDCRTDEMQSILQQILQELENTQVCASIKLKVSLTLIPGLTGLESDERKASLLQRLFPILQKITSQFNTSLE